MHDKSEIDSEKPPEHPVPPPLSRPDEEPERKLSRWMPSSRRDLRFRSSALGHRREGWRQSPNSSKGCARQ